MTNQEDNLTPQDFEALGRLLVAFANLEGMTAAFAWNLVSDDVRVGQVMTWRGRFDDLRQHVDRLVRVRSPGHSEQIARWSAQAKGVTEKRNRVIHGWWAQTEEGIYQANPTKKPGTFRMNRFRREQVSEVIEQIQAAADSLLQIAAEISPTLPAILRKVDDPEGS